MSKISLDGRHPGTVQHLTDLQSDHLPETLRAVVQPIETVGHHLASFLSDGPRLTTGLGLLVQAKDALVRQRVADLKAAAEPAPVNTPEPELRDE
jgi:hypothetical protein